MQYKPWKRGLSRYLEGLDTEKSGSLIVLQKIWMKVGHYAVMIPLSNELNLHQMQ